MAKGDSGDWHIWVIRQVWQWSLVHPLRAGLAAVVLLAGVGLWLWWKTRTAKDAPVITVNVLPPPSNDPPPPLRPESPTLCVPRLPNTGPDLFGRADDLATLDEHLAAGARVVTVVAEGGVGKTALAGRWVDGVIKRDWARVYAWSFYSQGTDRQTSAGPFVDDALQFFGHCGETPKSEWERGRLLAGLVQRQRALLILDGLEPLQHGPGPLEGRLKDQAMQALLKELAAANPGLCLVTTRQAVADLAGRAGVATLELHTLAEQAGAELLAKLGVTGSEAERRRVSRQFGGHALALTLLGTFLRDVHHGDIRKAGEVRLLEADRDFHARHVLDAYVVRLEPRHLAVLGLAGLFDRPATPDLVTVLRAPPVLPGLTDALAALSEAEWKLTLAELRRAHLLLAGDALDAHPLVREYFGDRLRNHVPEAWKAAHSRLYEHLRDTTDEFPDSRDGLQPLYQAVAHGCAAGRYDEALDEVLYKRIGRGDEYFSLHQLGDFGGYLSVLSGLFPGTWGKPVAALSPAAGAWVVNQAGSALRALGRLDEALAAMRAGLAAQEGQENWTNAAIAAANLSEALLLAGLVGESVTMTEHAVERADRSGDLFQRMVQRTDFANALAQAGRMDQAAELFATAEAMEAERWPAYPLLTSLRGFQYCDLLLERSETDAVAGRAAQARNIAIADNVLLDIALATLSLGRAALANGDRGAAATLLTDAVGGLRQAGTDHQLPRGLLARAELHRRNGDWDLARRDLDEVREIAERSGMKLYLTDLALEEARLAVARGREAAARDHLATARALVAETGYHRRDAAVADLQRALGVT